MTRSATEAIIPLGQAVILKCSLLFFARLEVVCHFRYQKKPPQTNTQTNKQTKTQEKKPQIQEKCFQPRKNKTERMSWESYSSVASLAGGSVKLRSSLLKNVSSSFAFVL